jgi:hypothetical protein
MIRGNDGAGNEEIPAIDLRMMTTNLSTTLGLSSPGGPFVAVELTPVHRSQQGIS